MAKFVKSVITDTMQNHFAHMVVPPLVGARVLSRRDMGEIYEYVLQITTQDGSPDSNYPELPEVRSKILIETGHMAIVGLLYGNLTAIILGEIVS